MVVELSTSRSSITVCFICLEHCYKVYTRLCPLEELTPLPLGNRFCIYVCVYEYTYTYIQTHIYIYI